MYSGINAKKTVFYLKFTVLVCIIFIIMLSSSLVSCANKDDEIETSFSFKGTISTTVETTGYVDSSDSKKLSLPVSGKVIKAAEKGDFLKKGDLVLEVDRRKADIMISQAGINVSIAQSSLKQAEISYKGALDANHIAVQIAEENNKLAEQSSQNSFSNLENINALGNSGVENAKAALSNAQNSFNTSTTQAKAALEQANYQLSVARANSLPAITVAQYEAAAVNAQAAYDSAVNAASGSIDSAAGAINQAEDQARVNSFNAQSAYEQALVNQSITYWNTLSSLQQAKRQIEATLAGIATAQEQVKLAQLNLELSDLEIENYAIYMPFDGIIQEINYKEGEYLSPAAFAVSVIKNDFIVKADIEESDIKKIKTGLDVEMDFDALSGEKLIGTVSYISPVSKNLAGVVSFQIEIIPEEAVMEELLLGISSNVTIFTDKKDDVLLVPVLSVFDENGGSIVNVLNDEGKIIKKKVETGLSDFENIEILSGLSEGEKVLLSNPEETKTNMFGR